MSTPADGRGKAIELMRRWNATRAELDEVADALGCARLTDEEWAEISESPTP